MVEYLIIDKKVLENQILDDKIIIDTNYNNYSTKKEVLI
mgnify:CR=1 FL=1